MSTKYYESQRKILDRMLSRISGLSTIEGSTTYMQHSPIAIELEEKIIGKQYNSDTYSKVKRIVEECLLVNKYIKSIDNVAVSFNDKINIEIELTTVYQKGVIVEYVY